jgi:recombination protein RecT
MEIKRFFEQDSVKRRFTELLGDRSAHFIVSLMQVVAQNELLKSADPISVYNAAVLAATLELPINSNLGFAYIVPYNTRQKDGTYKQVAQFQIGYRGLIQLAHRTGQFKTISAAPIYEGQIVQQDPLKGYVFDFSRKDSDKVIGFAAYFSLINGFEKTLYMSTEQLKSHGLKYSNMYRNEKTRKSSMWETDFESMALKTVLKLLLWKYAPLSIQMQRAIIADQAVIKDESGEEVEYVDNQRPEVDKESERVRLMIEQASTVEELDKLFPSISHNEDYMKMWYERNDTITKAQQPNESQ